MSKLKESSEHFCQTQRESCNPDIPCMLSFINLIFRVKLQLWIISTVRCNYGNVNTLYFLQRLVVKRCICEVFWHISSAPGSVSHFLCLIVQATLLRYWKSWSFRYNCGWEMPLSSAHRRLDLSLLPASDSSEFSIPLSRRLPGIQTHEIEMSTGYCGRCKLRGSGRFVLQVLFNSFEFKVVT